MKTNSTSILQFSSYPLKMISSPEDKQHLQIIRNEKEKQGLQTLLARKVYDIPENWDESWFGNYE